MVRDINIVYIFVNIIFVKEIKNQKLIVRSYSGYLHIFILLQN